ncbi:MAG: hypothetical protein N2517_03680 [Ignavibacteria bacterium]|nr:hypothetical protein [Ignavibacteria bacterium]
MKIFLFLLFLLGFGFNLSANSDTEANSEIRETKTFEIFRLIGLDELAKIASDQVVPNFRYLLPTIPDSFWAKIEKDYDSAKVVSEFASTFSNIFENHEITQYSEIAELIMSGYRNRDVARFQFFFERMDTLSVTLDTLDKLFTKIGEFIVLPLLSLLGDSLKIYSSRNSDSILLDLKIDSATFQKEILEAKKLAEKLIKKIQKLTKEFTNKWRSKENREEIETKDLEKFFEEFMKELKEVEKEIEGFIKKFKNEFETQKKRRKTRAETKKETNIDDKKKDLNKIEIDFGVLTSFRNILRKHNEFVDSLIKIKKRIEFDILNRLKVEGYIID